MRGSKPNQFRQRLPVPRMIGNAGLTFLQINQLEQINLLIDNVALGNMSLSGLDHLPGLELPPGIGDAADAGIDYFQSVRIQNNAQIDQLLQQLGAPPWF
jgi:hypothetical protein